LLKEDEMGGACDTHGEGEKYIQNFGSKALREEPLGRPRHRWEENIKIVVREIRLEGVDSINLAQDGDR
jgi:hypothetical protein